MRRRPAQPNAPRLNYVARRCLTDTAYHEHLASKLGSVDRTASQIFESKTTIHEHTKASRDAQGHQDMARAVV